MVAGKREDGTINIIDAHLHVTKPVTYSGYVEEKRAALLHGEGSGPMVPACSVNRASADPA